MTARCLNEEELMELYYADSPVESLKSHLSTCQDCQKAFHELCNDMINLELSVPDGGHKAVEEALRTIDMQQSKTAKDEILTLEEVSAWLKVSTHNVMNMLHLLPHFIIDGNIRFEREALKKYLHSQNSGAEMKAPDQPRHGIISLASRRAV